MFLVLTGSVWSPEIQRDQNTTGLTPAWQPVPLRGTRASRVGPSSSLGAKSPAGPTRTELDRDHPLPPTETEGPERYRRKTTFQWWNVSFVFAQNSRNSSVSAGAGLEGTQRPAAEVQLHGAGRQSSVPQRQEASVGTQHPHPQPAGDRGRDEDRPAGLTAL